MNYTNKFAERLKILREKKGVSAKEMSHGINQRAGYIDAIENIQYMPSMRIFFSICEFLDVTPSEFFYFNDNVKIEDEIMISNKAELIGLLNELNFKQRTIFLEILREINKNMNK